MFLSLYARQRYFGYDTKFIFCPKIITRLSLKFKTFDW